jgi:hypothetical protein
MQRLLSQPHRKSFARGTCRDGIGPLATLALEYYGCVNLSCCPRFAELHPDQGYPVSLVLSGILAPIAT